MKGLVGVGFVVVFGLVACDGSVPFDEVDGAESWDLAASDSMPADVSSVPEVTIGHDTGSVQNEMRLYKSGSRIKAKVMTTEDGAQAFMGWYDTVLEIDCSMGLVADDGNSRCLPIYLIVYDMGYFSDSGCLNPLYWTGKSLACDEPSPEWLTFQSAWCGGGYYSVYRDGRVYVGSTVFQKGVDGSCVDVSSVAKSGYLIDFLGDKQSATTFAAVSAKLVD